MEARKSVRCCFDVEPFSRQDGPALSDSLPELALSTGIGSWGRQTHQDISIKFDQLTRVKRPSKETY
jgi:hypothetical protein